MGLIGEITAPCFVRYLDVFSIALLIPAFLGMQLGFKLSDRLDPEKFRKITLIVLLIAGANLVRRGIIG